MVGPRNYAVSFCATMDAEIHLVFPRPFRADHSFWAFPGLKPWAESFSPFGPYVNDAKHRPAGAPFETQLIPIFPDHNHG